MTYQPEKGCYQAFRDIGVQFVSVAVYAGDRSINPRSGIRPFQATLESALLHGKPWFVEADVRTLLSRPISQAMPHADPEVNRAYDGPVWLGPDNMPQSLGDMLRAFSRIVTHNGAMWWFDMWGGWYDDEQLMVLQKGQRNSMKQPLWQAALRRARNWRYLWMKKR